MGGFRKAWSIAVFAAALTVSRECRAIFDWHFKEIFTSADGAVQFIELFAATDGERLLNGHTITADSDGLVKSVTLVGNLPTTATANRHLLFATAGFENLPGGVARDYVALPANFFNPDAASITFNFGHGWDVVTLAGSQLPKNGVNSLNEAVPLDPGQVFVSSVNSPTNYAGATGSVNLGGSTPTPGDFDGNGMVNGADLTRWRTNFGATGAPTVSQGNADADGDVDGSDFLLWQRNVTASSVPAAAAIPEPGTLVMAAGAMFMTAVVGRRRG